MNNTISSKTAGLNKDVVIKLTACAGIALFWVIFLWNFFDKGPYALGLNMFVFLSLGIALFLWVLSKQRRYATHDLTWIIPLCLIAVSFLLYDNPFLKMTSILAFTALFAAFYNYAFLDDKQARYWDAVFLFNMLKKILSFIPALARCAMWYLEMIIPAGQAKRNVISRVIMGLVLFVVIALIVFVPLLSSADAVFADKIQMFYDWIRQFFSAVLVSKFLVFIILSVVLSAMLLAWGKSFSYQDKAERAPVIDPIIAGIVLGGIFLLYVLFLWLQLERLWVGELPFDFRAVEDLVKSGFWQLLFLSVINIVIYLVMYRKTAPAVQKILAAFMTASLLLLFSAGQRMGLYVTYYGFSYEKFFASYTVIYCAILFAWLLSRLFVRHRSDVIKFVAVLFLWMYAIITVLPVEQGIVRANVALSALPDSKIRLFEMTMLSHDVLSLIERYNSEGVLKEKAGYLTRENAEKPAEDFDWGPWIEGQRTIITDKKWYEKNIMNVITRY